MPGGSSSWWRGEGRGEKGGKGEVKGELFSSSLTIATNPHGTSSFETSPKSNHFPKVPEAPWLPQLKPVSPLRFFLPWWVVPSNYEPKIKSFPFHLSLAYCCCTNTRWPKSTLGGSWSEDMNGSALLTFPVTSAHRMVVPMSDWALCLHLNLSGDACTDPTPFHWR